MAEETQQPVEFSLDTAKYELYNQTRRGLNWEVMNPKVVVLQDQATITSDCSSGNHFRVTLQGNRTIAAPINMRDGQRVVWEFIQDASGTRTVTLNSIFAFGDNPASFTATTTANKRDFLCAIYNKTENKFYVVATVKNF